MESVETSSRSLAFSATVLDQFTSDSPAHIRITASNTTSEKREFGFPGVGPYPQDFAEATESDGVLFVTVPSDDSTGEDPYSPPVSAPCWSYPGTLIQWASLSIITLDPGEATAEDYVVSGPTDGCLSGGTYRFTESFGSRVTADRVAFTLDVEMP